MNSIAVQAINMLTAGVLLCLSLTSFAQYNPAPNPFGQSGTGYTNDGTLMMGGQRIGNPHQILHDLNVPSFFGVNANRLSFSDNPSYGQGTLAQMENHTLTIGVPAGNVILSRLYLTPTNPYTQGVAAPHNNYQTYQGVVADAQAGSYQLTVANDNKLYAFKTLGTLSSQSQNILIKELPAHSVFIANSDPNGGAVAVRVTQSGDYAAMQNYFDTVKPYDFSWRSAMGAWADGVNRPSNVSALTGVGGQIGNDEAGFVFFNWVMGSNDVKNYQQQMQNQLEKTGVESFGVLTWDSALNKYAMLYPNDVKATANSVSGAMPTLGQNQTAMFGIHTHSDSATPSNQDLKMTEKFGLDQVVIGNNGSSAIFASAASNSWQGQPFKFEGAYLDSISGAGYGPGNGSDDPKGVGGVSSGIASPTGNGVYLVGGNSGNSANGLILDSHGHVIGGDVIGNSDYQTQLIDAWINRYGFGVLRGGLSLVRGAYNYIRADKRSEVPSSGPATAADITTLVEQRTTPYTKEGMFNVKSESELKSLLDDLTKGAEEVQSPTPNGKSWLLDDGTRISYRPESASGGGAIDISRKTTGGSAIKVHVPQK